MIDTEIAASTYVPIVVTRGISTGGRLINSVRLSVKIPMRTSARLILFVLFRFFLWLSSYIAILMETGASVVLSGCS